MLPAETVKKRRGAHYAGRGVYSRADLPRAPFSFLTALIAIADFYRSFVRASMLYYIWNKI